MIYRSDIYFPNAIIISPNVMNRNLQCGVKLLAYVGLFIIFACFFLQLMLTRMSDRDDFAELVGSAKSVIKCSSLYFNGRIRYGTKGEKVEERLLCMDAVKVYICSIKIPVKIESQVNILSIKLIERISDSHVSIETDEKQIHTLYGLHDKCSLQPFLIVLIRNLQAVFPHRLQALVDFRPDDEYDRLLRLSHESYQDINEYRPCGGFSLRYECACDFHQIPCNRSVQILVDTVFAYRISREFTFREFEGIAQREWLPVIGALRYNEWFRKLTIEDTKLSAENIDEICTVIRFCKSIKDLRLSNCGLRHDFCTRFSQSLPVSYIRNLDLSNNTLEDKGVLSLISSLQQRKLPLISINLQSCSLTHRSLTAFNTTLIINNNLLKSLQILNLSGNRLKEENCITILFQNSETVLEELHLSDIEFSLESFFHSLASLSCKLRRLFISSVKSSVPSTVVGGVKTFFTKNQTLEILQLSNANLSDDFLKELCDGLHANVHLNKLDLRISGNELEEFIHEYATRFASIPCLSALDITGCDLDNEIPNFLNELKKNRNLKTLHLGKNFNNIKNKNMQRTINAMKDLVLDSDLEYLSIADSKLKENTTDFLLALMHNSPLKTLDIRGNLIGDSGVRVITHILQMNRHLHTLYLDRNLLSLSNFEDIIDALNENYSIQCFPVPIIDIIQMKITEKDRMEKVQMLMNKLDGICTRNQQQKTHLSSNDSLISTTTSNLTREMNSAWDNQQQLIGDQASLDYALSCSSRLTNPNNNNNNNNNDELNSILTRIANTRELSIQLYQLYIDEEEGLKNQWNEICRNFQEKFVEKNERLAKKFYQLFKEQGIINYDDKFQEQIRTFFMNSNENMNQLLTKEIPNRIINDSRQCYINVVTCLQKRAYDTTNDIALDMHKQIETAMFHTKAPQQGSTITEGQHQTSPSTSDRNASGRSSSVVYRSLHKQNPVQSETNEDLANNRHGKTPDVIEYTPNPSPKPSRTTTNKDPQLFPTTQSKSSTPASPKPLTPELRKSLINNANERDSSSLTTDPIYSNVQVSQGNKQEQTSNDDEGDLIEHDILNLVAQEQQRDTPPALPKKERSTITKQDHLDINIEPTAKLVHPGKDRPRRANIRPPVKRSTTDSSSDGALLTDDNSQGDVFSKSTNEIHADQQTNDSSAPTVAKFIKSALKSSESPSITSKLPLQLPIVQPRSLINNTMTRSMTLSNNDAPHLVNSDSTNESFQTKTSMSTSLYSPFVSSNNNNEQINNSIESIPTPTPPPIQARKGKAAFGACVLPSVVNGELPKLKPLSERKSSFVLNSSLTDNSSTSDVISNGTGDSSDTVNSNEQSKPLSVKDRARMLGATIPSGISPDKKSVTSSSSTTLSSKTPPYTPRTYRRIIEQVNLFC